MSRDYYEILGVGREADADTIKKAYRKMAMKYHPDKNPDDSAAEEKFKEAAKAYEVLSNKEKRARYDRFGHAGVDGNAGFGGGFQDVSDVFSAFGDIFGDMFGQRGSRSRGGGARRGADLRYQLEISLNDVVSGAQKEIRFEVEENCGECSGSGSEKGTTPSPCKQCGGSGQFVRNQGFFSFASPCSVCSGSGVVIVHPCRKCSGSGRKRVQRNLAVNIPAGVSTGTQLRLNGEGEPGGAGSPSGDLYVEIFVQPDRRFERRDNHLVTELKITYLEALLGAEVNVETLLGQTKVVIPVGTGPGEVIRVAGEGLPSLRGARKGDLLLAVVIEFPKKLSKKEEKLLREIAEDKGLKVSRSSKLGLFSF